MTDKYILKDKVPTPIENLIEWGKWFKNIENRKVNKTALDNDVNVSTVFLGLDHQWGDGEPILFETMIFGGEHDGYQERCSTWGEAEIQHEIAVEFAKST